MDTLIGLINALGALLWPVLAFSILFAFNSEFRSLLRSLSRIKRGKFFGQEIELERELIELRESTERAVAEVPALGKRSKGQAPTDDVDDIFKEAGGSPRVALLLLSAKLEREVRRLLAATGWSNSIPASPLSEAIERLKKQGSLPASVTGSLKQFLEVRNRLVHGHDSSEKDILRAIDSGSFLLKSIESIPAEVNVVHEVGVPLFADAKCAKAFPNVLGVILETTSPGGTQKTFRVFPTTQTYFKKGKRVAWEWNLKNIWTKAWYRDPDSGKIKPAWDSSGEFVGRNLDDF